MTKYTIDESVIEAVEGAINLLNSKDLNDVSRANKMVPTIMATMRMCPESHGEDKCQCGLDDPCEEGNSLLQGERCSAGYSSCYILDERKGIAKKFKRKNVVC